MAKFRYLIEDSGNEAYPFHVAMVKEDGDTYGGGYGNDYETLEIAKATAERYSRQDHDKDGDPVEGLTWKPAPKEWDAYCVSQYVWPEHPDLPT